jgi:hypothetical protein
MKIKKIIKLGLGNIFYHLDGCRFDPRSVKELTQGDWQRLVSLRISNIRMIKVGVANLKTKSA